MIRYFWIVDVAAVILCASMAGRAATHVVEGAWLNSSPPKRATVAAAPQQPPASPRDKTGAAIVARNMFCSTCVPMSEQPELVVSSDGTPVVTALPLVLVATTIAGDHQRSFATIRDRIEERLGAYRVGEGIPGAGEVVHIGPRYVDFRNQAAGRVERLDLLATQSSPKKTRKRARKRKSRGGYGDLDDRIHKIDDTHYEIDRSLITAVLTNPKKLGRSRIVPSVKNGQPNGFKVYRVRARSPLARIGIKNGDTIHAVNGFRITSPDKALEAYTKLRSANSVSLSLTRRGKRKTLQYSIR